MVSWSCTRKVIDKTVARSIESVHLRETLMTRLLEQGEPDARESRPHSWRWPRPGDERKPELSYHKSNSNTVSCKALPSTTLPFTMRYWAIADWRRRLIVAEPRTRPINATQAGPRLERAVRDYVRAYARLHG